MVVGVLNFMSIYTVSIKSGLQKVTQLKIKCKCLMLICPPSIFEAKLSIQCNTCTTSLRVDIQVYSVLQKLYLIRSWCDLFHDWYKIIIARRVVLTNLITNFSKTRLQFILQHTKCSRKWWFLGAYNMFYSSRGFDGRSLPRNGAFNCKPYRAVKHLYMFVIDAGVAVLRKYGIGGTLRCKVMALIIECIRCNIYQHFKWLWALRNLII